MAITDETEAMVEIIFIDGREHYGQWRKNEKNDTIWWWDDLEHIIGPMIFSFDKERPLNIWTDYGNLKPEEKAIFDKENPFWADFFSGGK